MKIIKPQTLSLLTRPFEFRREYWLGVAVVAFLPVGETPVLLEETALWPFLAEELPADQPLDAVIPKLQPEFLAVAQCYAPAGEASPLVRTGIQLGPLIKLLDVYGDRVFDQRARRITESVPFTHMAIDWTRAYGGPGFADNPAGRGMAPADGSEARSFRSTTSSIPSWVGRAPGFPPRTARWTRCGRRARNWPAPSTMHG